MIALLFLITILITWRSGCVPGAVGLLLAVVIFLSAITPELQATEYIVIVGFVLAIPGSAYLAGALLDNFAHKKIEGRVFQGAAMILAFMLILSSPQAFTYFEEALLVVRGSSWQTNILFFSGVLNAILFCGGLIALVLMLLHLTIELPVRWLQGASGLNLVYTFAPLRPLVIILGATFCIDLMIGLFAAELWPETILRSLRL